MKREAVFLSLVSLILSGCVVRTYPLIKDRVDQELSGNRGYIKGDVPAVENKERKDTRRTQVIEVELSSPLKFEGKPKAKPIGIEVALPVEKTEDSQAWGNQGFLTRSDSPEIVEPATETVVLRQYTVGKGDTLQKISKKFYGSSRKWMRIYEANKGVLKGPNKIFPGQVLNIPDKGSRDALATPPENLK